MEEEKKLIVIDENGKEKEMEIMLTFENQGKKYVVYFDPNSEEEETDVFTSVYDDEGNLYPVETDEEWDFIEEVLQSFLDEEDDVLGVNN